ncbi:MAG: redoxin domain-containing protein, partial [Planctomycetota bacterium]|nr:redoxin domain-containing protein [Planctomycetota bacterium]
MHLTRRMLALGLCALLLLGGIADQSAAEEQKPKLDFALRDMNGVAHRLSQYRGKWVVLEWIGFDCEPVNEAYRAPARKLPALQQTWRGKGVVWLSINSNAVGQRGYVEPAKCKAALTKLGANPTALLLDPTGVAGKTFGAQVTPEVRVISPRGDVVYGGGFEGVAAGTTVRYLETVLNAATSGRAIPYAGQSARGCRILYQAAQPAAPVATGPKAQDFRLTDSNGVVRRLSDYRGKWVILEWINFDCPYVQKQYDRSHRSMQKLHARSKRLGIVWLCICSS